MHLKGAALLPVRFFLFSVKIKFNKKNAVLRIVFRENLWLFK